MISNIDHHGSEKVYGWTRDHDGNVWYWSVPHGGGPEDISFTERGTPTDHPIRKTGRVAGRVRNHAEAYLDAELERDSLPWH